MWGMRMKIALSRDVKRVRVSDEDSYLRVLLYSRIGWDRTGQDRTGQDRTGQDRTGQDIILQRKAEDAICVSEQKETAETDR